MKLLTGILFFVVLHLCIADGFRTPGSSFASKFTERVHMKRSERKLKTLLAQNTQSCFTPSQTNEHGIKAPANDAPPSNSQPIAQATILGSSTNLLKNCVGAGVFSLCSRVNAFTTDPREFPKIIMMIIIMATWGIHNFYILGETCKITKSKTFGEAWGKSISPKTQWIPQFVVTMSPMISSLANIIVLTDVFTLFLKVIGLPMTIYSNRLMVISLLLSFVLFPICTVKNLSGLKNVSLIGLTGQFIAMISLFLRLLDGSYRSGGKYFETANIGAKAKELITQTTSSSLSSTLSNMRQVLSTSSGTGLETSKLFVLASLLSYCFVTHYNAPRYYTELKDEETKPKNFLFMAMISYYLAAAVYLAVILLPNYLWTPFNIQSFVLNSFSSNDPLGVFAYFAFGISVIASFPIIFFTMRNWWISQAEYFQWNLLNSIPRMSMMLLMIIGSIGVIVKDIGKVGSMAGAIFGSTMMFIFPPLMYMNVLIKQSRGVYDQSQEGEGQGEGQGVVVQKRPPLPMGKLVWNGLLLLGGLTIASMGTYNSFKSLFK